MEIYLKIRTTFGGGEENYKKIKEQYDLWGPLVISLFTATMGTLGTIE